MHEEKGTGRQAGSNRKYIFWGILSVVLAVLSIRAVLSGMQGTSLSELLAYLKSADPLFLFLAVLCSAGFIIFEGLALSVIVKQAGYALNLSRGQLYGAADVYFSAITPSASGGQPASAFFMLRDGIPAAVVTASLILNLLGYTVALLSLGLLSVLLRPGLFGAFPLPCKIMILLGTLTMVLLTLGFFMLLSHAHFLFGIVGRVLTLLSRFKIVRNPEKRLQRLEKTREDYQECVRIFSAKPAAILWTFLLNLLQRLSQILVTLMVFLALGGKKEMLLTLFADQTLLTLGFNCVPVPGAMGAADYLMLSGYQILFDRAFSFRLELIGRILSFYGCISISALIVLIGYLSLKKKRRT